MRLPIEIEKPERNITQPLRVAPAGSARLAFALISINLLVVLSPAAVPELKWSVLCSVVLRCVVFVVLGLRDCN